MAISVPMLMAAFLPASVLSYSVKFRSATNTWAFMTSSRHSRWR
jgi:hypothetical protein